MKKCRIIVEIVKERENKNNIVIRRLKIHNKSQVLSKKVKDRIKENLKVEVKVKKVYMIGKNNNKVLVAKMESWPQKNERDR